MKTYTELEFLKIFQFANISLLNKLLKENNTKLIEILAKQIFLYHGVIDQEESYFKNEFLFEFGQEYNSIKKEIKNTVYSNIHVFVIYELENLINLMNDPEYSFDDSSEKVENILSALKNGKLADVKSLFNSTDQYTRSYFSDSLICYFSYIS